ncbi:MAG: hypothetical protein LBK64_07150 [Spirochaetaceae bacterium]|jgi:hypothetical protein|nr:hypothetical protein [Spirochaetaceae bacterium]
MKIKLQIVLILILFSSCTKTNVNLDDYFGVDLQIKEWDHEYGMPLIYLKDTFSPITGGSQPKFVLYENRQLIYGKIENDEIIYYETLLSEIEMKNIFKELGIPNNYFIEKNHINIITKGEPPLTALIINTNFKKIITMYGSADWMDEAQEKDHKKLVNIYRNIINYNNQNAKRWMPDHFEVILADWENEPTSKLSVDYTYINEWPSHFPDLLSADTVQINDWDYIFSFKIELYNDFTNYVLENFGKYPGYKTVIINNKNLWLAPFCMYMPLPNIKYWKNKS